MTPPLDSSAFARAPLDPSAFARSAVDANARGETATDWSGPVAIISQGLRSGDSYVEIWFGGDVSDELGDFAGDPNGATVDFYTDDPPTTPAYSMSWNQIGDLQPGPTHQGVFCSTTGGNVFLQFDDGYTDGQFAGAGGLAHDDITQIIINGKAGSGITWTVTPGSPCYEATGGGTFVRHWYNPNWPLYTP